MAWSDEMANLSDEVVDTFGTTITIVRTTPGNFDTTTMTRARTQVPLTISAERSSSFRSFVAPGGAVNEQVVYTVRAADLTFEPGTNDTVQETETPRGGAPTTITRSIVKIEPILMGRMRRITCQRGT